MVHRRISIPLYLLLIIMFIPQAALAQDDLDDLLDDLSEEVETENFILGTFKSPRIINGQSIEMIAPGAMEFRISHRFGRLNGGAYNLWGLDQSTIRLELDFGITDWLMTGFARSTYEKTYDGFLKAKLTRQTDAPSRITHYFSSAITSGIMVRSQDWPDPRFDSEFTNRLSYYHMIMLARKFNQRLSLQFTGALTMENFVETNLDANLRGSAGLSGRFKLTNRIAVTAEYFYRIPFRNYDFASSYQDYYNSLSLGFDIETGGHVFQLHFTNSLPMMERGFLNETTGNWLDGDIHFGFNITREFTLRSNQK